MISDDLPIKFTDLISFVRFDRDALFTDSPDVGDPACLCSRCHKPIERGVPIRVCADDNREYRYHPQCVGMTAYDDEEEVRPEDDDEVKNG